MVSVKQTKLINQTTHQNTNRRTDSPTDSFTLERTNGVNETSDIGHASSKRSQRQSALDECPAQGGESTDVCVSSVLTQKTQTHAHDKRRLTHRIN